MLADVEARYGPRDRSYTVLGIEFGPGNPQLWYPGNRDHIVVQLDANALDNRDLALFQLAHECVHLLAPTGSAIAPVLEEGLATVYSEDYVRRETGRSVSPDVPSYAHAALLVRRLLQIDSTAIRKLRVLEPSFVRMTPTHIQAVVTGVDAALANDLVAPFDRART